LAPLIFDGGGRIRSLIIVRVVDDITNAIGSLEEPGVVVMPR
jgi:hypothetical protein